MQPPGKCRAELEVHSTRWGNIHQRWQWIWFCSTKYQETGVQQQREMLGTAILTVWPHETPMSKRCRSPEEVDAPIGNLVYRCLLMVWAAMRVGNHITGCSETSIKQQVGRYWDTVSMIYSLCEWIQSESSHYWVSMRFLNSLSHSNTTTDWLMTVCCHSLKSTGIRRYNSKPK